MHSIARLVQAFIVLTLLLGTGAEQAKAQFGLNKQGMLDVANKVKNRLPNGSLKKITLNLGAPPTGKKGNATGVYKWKLIWNLPGTSPAPFEHWWESYTGQVPNENDPPHAYPPFNEITLFPGSYTPPNPPDPQNPGEGAGDFAGQTTAVLIHEIMHWDCPNHAEYITPPPGLDPPDPDKVCALLNYWVETGKALCNEIEAVGQCNDDPACDDPDFPKDGSSTPSLADYCKGMCKAYKELQDKRNTPENARLWEACVCTDGWTPGPGFGDCRFEQPPNCPNAFPDGKIIPDCPCPCNDSSVDDPQEF